MTTKESLGLVNSTVCDRDMGSIPSAGQSSNFVSHKESKGSIPRAGELPNYISDDDISITACISDNIATAPHLNEAFTPHNSEYLAICSHRYNSGILEL